jgi:homoserine kinase type II
LARVRRLAPRLREELRESAAREVPLQPCLRDARPEHFLFDTGRLTGLVDLGAMGVESVAADLARLLADWPGVDPPRRRAAWEAYTSVRALDPSETLLVEVFERSAALLGPGRWVRWHFVEGRRFEDPRAVCDGLARGLGRLKAVLDDSPGNRVRLA